MAGRRKTPWRERCPVPEGELELLSAWQVLQARREGEELAGDGLERALCDNACLIARALTRRGRPVYDSGRQVLEELRAEDIARLAQTWADFNRAHNPSPQQSREGLEAEKKGWRTRLMSAFSGACCASSGPFPPSGAPGT